MDKCEARDRPAQEDEVTAEMVEAGIRELVEYNWQTKTESSAVRRIYFAMRKLEPALEAKRG